MLSGLLDALQNNNALLDQIQKCLEAYLESKRVVFPRYIKTTTTILLLRIFEILQCDVRVA